VPRSLVPHVVRDRVRAVGDARDRLRERQSGPLGVREVRDIAPRGDRVDARIGLARELELARVDVDADAAAVDLARPQLDEIQRRLGDVGLLGGLGHPLESLQRAGNGECGAVDSCLHDCPPLIGGCVLRVPARVVGPELEARVDLIA